MKKAGINKFRGTGVAIVTPFKKSGAIDFEAYEKILDYTINGGVDFIVALGTTGEASTLSKQEKKKLVNVLNKIREDISAGSFKYKKDSEDIHTDIQNKLEKSVIEHLGYRDYSELFYYFLIPAIILLILEVLLTNTVLMKVP